MKVLIVALIYGGRTIQIIQDNIDNAGYPARLKFVCTEGIANALNNGIDEMKRGNFDAVAFLANDIIEPDNWLKKKIDALQYPDAGVVASSLDCGRTEIVSELIISNWLIPKETIEKVGYFQESMFPYGPIDLDYCERCYAAGLKTYYVKDCLAIHEGSHATGNEYGWSKDEAVSLGWAKMYKKGDNFYKERL